MNRALQIIGLASIAAWAVAIWAIRGTLRWQPW